jgi:hypothetical protein
MMPSRGKSRRDEPPAWRWILEQIFGLIRQFGNSVIWALVVGFMIYQVAQTFRAFAGHVSVADLVFEISAHLNIVIAASVALSGLSTGLWLNELRRHRSTRKRLTIRTASLEKRLDPNRESSLLTSEGTTREEDQ